MKKALYLVLFVALLAACAPAPQSDLFPVRYLHYPVNDPMYVAVDMGYCKARGLDVQLSTGPDLSGPPAFQAIAAGQAEAAQGATTALINAVAAGLPVVGVADFQSSMPNMVYMHYLVRSDSKYHSVADLKGARVAVNNFKAGLQYVMFMALEQAGLSDNDVSYVKLPFPEMAPALAQNSVDVIAVVTPYDLQASGAYPGQFRELFNEVSIGVTRQWDYLVVNKDWATAHPKPAASLVACYRDAVAFMQAHQPEAHAIESKYIKLDVKYFPDYYWQPNAIVKPEDVQFWMDFMTKQGDLKVALDPTLVVDTNYSR